MLRDKLLAETFPEDGSWDPERVGTTHVHSITCCLSSLAQLAAHLGDAVLMQRVRAFYDGGLWQLRDEVGWTPESTAQTDSDHGEANNTGDILETALILGRHGCAAAFADAERILRCHLLPSQLRDAAFIEEPPNPEGLDGLRDMAGRHLGAFGFPAPYGHESAGQGRANLSFNMDIVGGACASIAAACREVVRADGTGVHVDLWFDWESEAACVQSPCTHDGRLTVRVGRAGPLWLRLPPWLEGGLALTGDAPAPRRLGDHLFWGGLPAGTSVEARVDLPEREIVLSPRLHRRPDPRPPARRRGGCHGRLRRRPDLLRSPLSRRDDHPRPGAKPLADLNVGEPQPPLSPGGLIRARRLGDRARRSGGRAGAPRPGAVSGTDDLCRGHRTVPIRTARGS